MEVIEDKYGAPQDTVVTTFLVDGSMVPPVVTILSQLAPGQVPLCTPLISTFLVKPFTGSLSATSVHDDPDISG